MKRLLPLALAAAAAGCSGLKISVYQYKGELSHSYRTRLADARGKAVAAVSRIEHDPILSAYFKKLESEGDPAGRARTPRQYLAVINAIREKTKDVEEGGIPRPVDTPKNDPEAKAAKKANELVTARLSVLEKELIEMGSLLESLSLGNLPLAGQDSEARALTGHVVRELNQLGRDIKYVVEFPDFGELLANDDDWRLINPVATFGGWGKSEYIVYKDETGNYQLKSAVFDPSDVAQAVRKSALRVLSMMSASFGVPLPGAALGAGTVPPADGLSAYRHQTTQLEETSENKKGLSATLEKQLKAVRKTHLEGANGALKAAFADQEGERALKAVLLELEIYQNNLRAIEGGN